MGSVPGGWSQVAAIMTNSTGDQDGKARGSVYAFDIAAMEDVEGVAFTRLDLHSADAIDVAEKFVGGKADVVLSDMAAASSGHAKTDHLRIVALCEVAFEVACALLCEGGTFVCKVLAGGAEGNLQRELKQRFAKVRTMKPPASRSDSSEKYLVATGFRSDRG